MWYVSLDAEWRGRQFYTALDAVRWMLDHPSWRLGVVYGPDACEVFINRG